MYVYYVYKHNYYAFIRSVYVRNISETNADTHIFTYIYVYSACVPTVMCLYKQT